jgi:hypothetical protein
MAAELEARRPMLNAKNPTVVTRQDLLSSQDYSKDRKSLYYPIMREHKKIRRIHIGSPMSISDYDFYSMRNSLILLPHLWCRAIRFGDV